MPQSDKISVSDFVLSLGFMYPDKDYTQIRVDVINDLPVITRWNIDEPMPSNKEILENLPEAKSKEQAKKDINDAQAMLKERFELYTRAIASKNDEDASEIQEEIKSIMDWMKEIRQDAA